MGWWDVVPAAISAGSQLIGALSGRKPVSFENINPYTGQMIDQFQDLLGQSDSRMQNLLSQAGSATGRLGGIESLLGGIQDQLGGIQAPGVDEGYNIYQQRRPELEEQALGMADRATQMYGERAGEVARRRADQAARDIMGQFGGQGYSGAASAAASRGAADVLSDYETDIARQRSGIAGGLLGQMLGQERGLAEQGVQTNFANTINNLLNQANLAGQRGNIFGQQAGLLGQLGSEYGTRSRGLLGGLGGLAAPQFQEATYERPGAATAMGIGSAASDLFSGLIDAGVFGGGGTKIAPKGK